jgi:hypothetical protein
MNSIWGEEHDIKMAEFDRQIEAIENKYSYIFADEINRITGEKPDKLVNHFISTWDSTKYGIGFLKDSYVPKHIEKEVIDSFVSIFSV